MQKICLNFCTKEIFFILVFSVLRKIFVFCFVFLFFSSIYKCLLKSTLKTPTTVED